VMVRSEPRFNPTPTANPALTPLPTPHLDPARTRS
jgi:hypothetical protein